MQTDVLAAGAVAAVTPAPLVVTLVLVGAHGRLRQATVGAAAVVGTLLISAEVMRRFELDVPSVDRDVATAALGTVFLVMAGALLAAARLGARRREIPWVDLLDAAGSVQVAALMAFIVGANIKNQTLLLVAMRDAEHAATSLAFAIVGAAGVLLLTAAGYVLRRRTHLLRAAHDWLERHQTTFAIVTLAGVGALLVGSGLS